MRDELTHTITFTEEHLNKTVYLSLKASRLTTYDITLENIATQYRGSLMKWIPRGYKMVFKHGDKTKLLIFNK